MNVAASADATAVAPPAEGAYVGHRRPLPPTAPIFELGNLERALTSSSLRVPTEEEVRLLSSLTGGGQKEHVAPKCSICHVALPSSHLLDLHLSEVHDSFFAAQAARKFKVYRCLLETCERRFATMAERKQHLIDAHCFPKTFDFEKMHLRQRKGQVRIAESLRRYTPKPGRKQKKQDAAAAANLAEEMSKLSGLGQPSLPQQVSFGRGRHAPMRGRGRGRSRGRGGRGRGEGVTGRGSMPQPHSTQPDRENNA